MTTVSQRQPCPQAQSHPKATHVPMVHNISKVTNVPSVPTAQLCPQDTSDPAACHIPKASHVPEASPVPEVGCVPRAAVSHVQGFPAQSIFFGLLLLSVAGRAIPGAGCHCLVLPMSPRNQPGHQICVRSSREEEHHGQNCGDPRWRGGKSSFVSPHVPTGCPQGTCTWANIPEPQRQPRQGGSDP